MRILICLLLLGTAGASVAAPSPDLLKRLIEAHQDARDFVRVDEANVYLGMGARSGCTVVPLDESGAFELSTQSPAIDAVAAGNTLYILTHHALEQWDLVTRARVALHATYPGNVIGPRRGPTGMARWGSRLILSHGRLGVTFFDTIAGTVTKAIKLVAGQGAKESMATAVAVAGDRAYVLMDSYTLNPGTFRGLVVIDMPGESVSQELDGMDPGATAIMSHGSHLVVSFAGMPVWVYARSHLGTTRLAEPVRRITCTSVFYTLY